MAEERTSAQWLEMLRNEQGQRWEEGERVLAETLLQQHLTLQANAECALELVYNEVLLREKFGDPPRLEEYVERFPQFAPGLKRLFEVHQVLESDHSLGGTPLEAAPATSSAALPDVPGYEVLREVGRGGMGIVYEARQIGLNRLVAIKMILAGDYASRQELARFQTEAKAVGRLQHPNIVQIHEVGEHKGRPYLAMEYVPGGSLAQKLKGTPLAARSAAQLLETLARAMHHAHERGILHRDLTPANVLLTEGGVPKIVDFGLAKLLGAGQVIHTQTGAVVGTPSYMAPEQAWGKTKEIGISADVYALGAILYELLTGRPPFRAETPLETLFQVQSVDPVSPSRLQPKLPRDLATICLQCLQKEPRKRYRDAQALANDLRSFLEGKTIQARPTGVGVRTMKWARRRPAVAALLALVVFVTALGFGLVTWQWLRAEASLYLNRIALAHRELSADNLRRAEELLDACPPRLRQWEWKYLKRLCRVEPVTIRDQKKGVYSVAFSPDGQRLASARGDGTVGILDVNTGEELQTLRGHTKYVFSVAFHPDGNHLASASADGTVSVWDLTTEKEEVFTRDGSQGNFMGAAYAVAFSPDGQHLAGSEHGKVIIWNAIDGQRLLELPGGAVSLAFSPDRPLLATGRGRVLRIWDTKMRQVLHEVSAHDSAFGAVAFRPDGRCLATASYDRTVKLWDVTTGKWLRTLAGHTGLVVGLAFSPDGRRLASTGEDKTIKIWDPETGQEILNLRDHTFVCRCVAFSPDGRRLASASQDTTIRIWDATPLEGNESVALLTLSHDYEVWSVAFSPDGRRLASGSWDKTVKVWDATTGETIRTLSHDDHDHAVMCVAFSPPDGKYLAAHFRRDKEDDALVRVWDTTIFRDVSSIPIREAGSFCVTFSPDGQYLLKEGKDHTVKAWDVKTGKPKGILGRHDEDIWCLRFSPDGRLLASASNDFTVKLWDATRLWQEQKPLRTIHLPFVHGFADRVAFSPDSRHLVTGGEERTVKIWDVRTGEQPLHTLRGHTGDVLCVAVSPDGRWIASAGEDTTVRLWDASTKEPVRKLRGHTSIVSSLCFSPDSRRLVSGSRDHTVRVWDLTRLKLKE